MKTHTKNILFSILWLAVLVAYVVMFTQLPVGSHLLLKVVAGVICIATAQSWSDLLTDWDHGRKAGA